MILPPPSPHLTPPPLRTWGAVTLLAVVLAGSVACSDQSPTGPNTDDAFLMVYFEGDSTRVELADLLWFDVDGQTAVSLEALVDTAMIPMYEDKDEILYDARALYGYRIVGEDGFSASQRGYLDNTWEQMTLGYILTGTRNVIFPKTAIDLPGAYNVKATRRVYVERKFDVVAADTTAFYRLADMPVVQVENFEAELEDAIALSAFVSALVADPAAHTYHITAIDGYGTADAMSWAQLQTGYWLLESQRTLFTEPTFTSGRYRLRMLERINVE
jgi:hypothetical protein